MINKSHLNTSTPCQLENEAVAGVLLAYESKVWMVSEHVEYIFRCVLRENTVHVYMSYILSILMRCMVVVKVQNLSWHDFLGLSTLPVFSLPVLSSSPPTLWAAEAVGPLCKSLPQFANHVDRQLPN